MDSRHFELTLISLILGALLAGLAAGLQAAPQTPLVIGAATAVSILLVGLRALYQRSPNEPDPTAGFVDVIQTIAAQVVASMPAPKPPVTVVHAAAPSTAQTAPTPATVAEQSK